MKFLFRRGRAIENPWRVFSGYVFAVVVTGLLVIFRAQLGVAIGDRPLLIIYIIPILISAYIGGLGPGFAATVVAASLTTYLAMDPSHPFRIERPVVIFQWGVFVATGAIASFLTEGLHWARRRAEESQHLHARIVASVPGVIYAFGRRPDNSTYVPYVSPSVEELFGVPPEVWKNEPSPMFSRMHPDDVEHVRASTAASGRNMTPWHDTFRVRHPVKGEIWVDARSIPEREADGGICWFGCVQDITEMKRLDERLRQAQKAEAIGQLTGGVAHDFNNLLGVISGNLELLNEAIPDRPDLRELAQSAIAAVDRGAALTRSLLAFARQQPLNPVATNVDRLVQELIPMLSRTLGETISISFTPSPTAPICEVDPGQLQSAIINLALNSRDAMPDGGKLTIATTKIDIEKPAESDSEIAPGAYAMLAVSDTGSGMSAEVAAKAFDPFFTTKGLAGGSGLGLSMVYGFVKQSRGHVTIESTPGHGTTVKLYLPRQPEAAVATAAATSNSPAVGHETILVVEDDKAMSRLVCRLLSAMGYAAREAATGAEALEILAHDRSIALVLSDVVLPGGMKGPQLLEAARAQRPGLKFLFMSGYTDNAIAEQGAAAYVRLLHKPFRRDELANALRATLDQRATETAPSS